MTTTMTRPSPTSTRLLDRLLAYDACEMNKKEALALFTDLLALPFDAFAFLPDSYRRTADMLVHTGQVTKPQRRKPR